MYFVCVDDVPDGRIRVMVAECPEAGLKRKSCRLSARPVMGAVGASVPGLMPET